MKTFVLTLLLIFLFTGCETKSQFQGEFTLRDIATELDTPWEILWGPDDHIWMTERYGRISRVNPETGDVTALVTLSNVYESNGTERGLMGMALHPDFDNEPYVYVVYNYQENNNTLVRVSRFTYSGNSIDPSTEFVIMDGVQGAQIHDGSRLWIDEDHKLFVTTGDAGNKSLAQDLDYLNGKTLRYNLDGSIPEDNPYPDSPLWSWGHRNAQGMVIHDGIMYQSEHGPADNDEVNIIYKGRNYGWPDVHGYCDLPEEEIFCQDSNVVEPIAAWTPTLAVAGIDFYDKALFNGFENSLLMVSLKAGKMTHLKLSEDGMTVVLQEHYFNGSLGRLRDLCISPDGKIFIATSNKDGRGSPAPMDDRIIELTPKSSSVSNIISDHDKIRISPNPVEGTAMVTLSNAKEALSQIKIIDNLGRIVLNIHDIPPAEIISGLSIDLTGNDQNIPEGIYHLILKNGDEYLNESFILSR